MQIQVINDQLEEMMLDNFQSVERDGHGVFLVANFVWGTEGWREYIIWADGARVQRVLNPNYLDTKR